MPELPPVRTQVAANVAPFVGGMGRATQGLLAFKGGLAAAAAGLTVFAGAKGLGAATRAWADFDAKMTESAAIMGDLSSKTMARMSAAAIDVSEVTQKSAGDAAESYFFLASAGLDAAQSIAALPQVARFAQAGMFDMATATSLAIDAQSALGLKVKDATENLRNLTRVTDVLVRANQLANANVQQFSEALTNKLAARLRMLNIPLEEGVGLLASLAEQGVKGKRAGQGLTIVLRDLAAGAVRNEEAFKHLGIRVFDAQGSFRNTADIIADFEDALGGMSDREKAVAFETLHINKRAQDFLNVLIGNSRAVREFTGELKNAGGATEEVADKQLKTLNRQLDLLHNNVQNVKIQLGGLIGPELSRDVEALRFVMNDLSNALADLNREAEAGRGDRGIGGFLGELETFFEKFGSGPIGTLLRVKTQIQGIRDAIIEAHREIDPSKLNVNRALAGVPSGIGAGEGLSGTAASALAGVRTAGEEHQKLSVRASEEARAAAEDQKFRNALENARLRMLADDLGLVGEQLRMEREKLRVMIQQGQTAEEIAAQAQKVADLERQFRSEGVPGAQLTGALARRAARMASGGLGPRELPSMTPVLTPDQAAALMARRTGTSVRAEGGAKSLENILSDPSPFGKVTEALRKGMIPALDTLAGKLHLGTGLLANFADALLTAFGNAFSQKGGALGFLGTAASGFAGGFAAGGRIPPGRFGVVHPGEMIMTGPANVQPVAGGGRGGGAPVRIEHNYSITIKAIDSQDLNRAIRERGGRGVVDAITTASRNSEAAALSFVTGGQ